MISRSAAIDLKPESPLPSRWTIVFAAFSELGCKPSRRSASRPLPAPIYGARALGVVALTPTGRSMLNSGGNIGSVTRIDTTHTQINFAVNMPYTNYVVSGCVLNDANLEFATFEHNVDNFKIRHSSDTAGRNVQFVVFA